ncbi:MAG: hypothetical protein GX230_06345 [Lentisphaerae bacterium]|nr:hypothetical protein [Lentisphaerota bacterium]
MTIRRLLPALIAVFTVMSAQAYPTVYNDPNNIVVGQWTRQADAAKAKAAELRRPMLVFFGDSASCGKCKSWDAKTLSTAMWSEYLAENGIILIWIDRSFNSAVWTQQKLNFGLVSFGFPKIFVLSPDGVVHDTFEATGTYVGAAAFINRIRPNISRYPYNPGPGTIGFTTSTAAVSESAGSVAVKVSRTGGASGAQTFTYATVNGTAVAGSDFKATSGTLTWADGDTAEKTITIPLINDGIWTTPLQRVFTLKLTKTSGNATVGTSLFTVTVTEVSENIPGQIGFASDKASVKEGDNYSGKIARSGGTTGAVSATITVNGDYRLSPNTVSWADGEGGTKSFTVSGIPVTDVYDTRSFTVTLSVSGANGGILSQTVDILDQIVTQTIDDYKVGKTAYQPLSLESGLWFYNSDVKALRSAPLGKGKSATLAWTAPAGGVLTFIGGEQRSILAREVTEPGVAAATVTPGILELILGGTSYPLTGEISASIWTRTYTVGVKAGDVVRWKVTGGGEEYMATLSGLVWKPLNAATPTSPIGGVLLQKSQIGANNALVNLKWTSGSGNPAGTVEHVYAGSSASALTDYGVAKSGANAVSLGIVKTSAGPRDVHWRVDTIFVAEYGTAQVAGTVALFKIIDLPVFNKNTPGVGSSVNVYLKVGTDISIAASSPTDVTYSATGLPKGTSINSTTGVISGTPQRAGTYQVTVSASNSGGTANHSFTMVAQPLPAYAKGRFQGALLDSDDVLLGTVNLTAGATGRLTGKVASSGGTVSLKGSWEKTLSDGSIYSLMTGRQGQELAVTVSATGLAVMDYDGASGFARVINKNLTGPYEGYYTVMLNPEVVEVGSKTVNNRPKGSGFIAVTVMRNGSVKYKGYTPDGTRLSGSSGLLMFNGTELVNMGYAAASSTVQHGAFPLFKLLYGRRGWVSALGWIAAGNISDVNDNKVSIDNSEWYYSGRSRALTDDSFRASFNGNPEKGGISATAELCGWAYAKPQDFQTSFAGALFAIDNVTAPTIVGPSSITLPSGNALKGRLTVRSTTGLVTGRITPPGERSSVTIKGIVVPELGLGGGYYLKADIAGGYRVKRSEHFTITTGKQAK